MKEFWDKQQEVFSRANSPSEAFKKGYFKFLANSDPGDIWRFLEIGDRIWKGIKVLNIGVGTGRDTESLHEKGVDVSVLDISPLALERVKDIANCFSPEKLEELPDNYFDLAISHLVTQHMSDEDLLIQLEHVIRSLKDTGIFAMQFAFAKDIGVGGVKEQELGECSRDLLRMIELVHKAGGEVKHQVKPVNFQHLVWAGEKRRVFWYGFHITKNGDKE